MNSFKSGSDGGSLLNVMVVDDQKAMRSIIKQLLRQEHFNKIVEAGNGAEAMKILADPDALLPDVIVCDLYMDSMDGMEFVHRLRRNGSPIPVIILTGEQNAFMHDVTRQAGATRVLPKPVSAKKLALEIQTAVGAY